MPKAPIKEGRVRLDGESVISSNLTHGIENFNGQSCKKVELKKHRNIRGLDSSLMGMFIL